MCECGCGDLNKPPLWAAQIKDRVLMAFDYRGCDNGCAAPLGFTLALLTKTQAKEWGYDVPVEEWRPEEGRHGFAVRYLNMFSQDHLSKAAKDISHDWKIEDDAASLVEIIEEDGLRLLRSAWSFCEVEENELKSRPTKQP